jgi:hypothetical protein
LAEPAVNGHPGRRAQITPGDLDISIVRELPIAQLPLGDQLKPGPLQARR